MRGLINPRSRWGGLVFDSILSPQILAEYLETIARPEIVAKFRSLPEHMRQVLDYLTLAEVVELSAIPAVSRDPKDDQFLATAAAGQADYLVTEDRDLLVLEQYEGIRIIPALAFLQLLRSEEERGR